jgi:DNA (cytosine-5)-methyltransferase 1
MAGGKRLNAGRKAISSNEKKYGYTIYLPQEMRTEIECYGRGASFSERCLDLIMKQLNYEKKTAGTTIRIIDLFAGLGGIRLGFQQALNEHGYKCECVFSSEIKDYAVKAYMNYFGDSKVNGDITKIKSSDIPDFDFLLAGFPCQPFSFAGKGLGFEDTRGTLFFEIERILSEKKPQGFLLENVEGLIQHNNGKTLATIINHLNKLEYKVNYALLDSKDFGMAQSRRRVYIVGTKERKINLDNFPISHAVLGDILETGLPTINSKFTKHLLSHYSIEQVIGKSIKDKRGGSNNIHSWDIGLKGETTKTQRLLLNKLLCERRKKKWAEEIGIDWMDGMPLTYEQIKTFFDIPNLQEELNILTQKGYLTLEHPRKLENKKRIPDITKPLGYNIVAGKLSFEFTKILNPNELSPTLVAMDVAHLGVVDGSGIRRLTIREAQRLCGYPEDYDLSIIKEKDAFDLLGNTVCVPVIKAIAMRICDTISVTKKETLVS